MNAFKIEDHIPAPTRGYVMEKYPFADMKIGNSFVVDTVSSSVHAAACAYVKREKLDWKFVSRRIGDKRRIWRVK